jgi:tetratricopeptide (TPR) repeat protein
MGILDGLFGKGGQKQTEISALDLSSDDFALDVVGESHYQDEIRRIAAGRTEKRERVEFRVVLIPEPDNEYDPAAVAVHAEQGGIVGYLASEDAAELQPKIMAMKKSKNRYPACMAVLTGGYGEKRSIGVVLDLDVDALGLDKFSGKPKVGGQIAYFGLTEWWVSTFSEQERSRIDQVLDIASGDVTYSSGTAAGLLSAVATNFYKPGDRHIAKCMLERAEEIAKAQGNVLDLHFVYQGMIETFYRDRDTEVGALSRAIEACERQIELAPRAATAWKREYPHPGGLPAHVGYTQLAIIRQKQGELDEAIRVCQQAKAQGWDGDWDARIARYGKARDRRAK